MAKFCGYTFEGERVLEDNQRTIDFLAGHLVFDADVGINDTKGNYTYYTFYAVVDPKKKYDLFRCKETGKLYIPCEHELCEWKE